MLMARDHPKKTIQMNCNSVELHSRTGAARAPDLRRPREIARELDQHRRDVVRAAGRVCVINERVARLLEGRWRGHEAQYRRGVEGVREAVRAKQETIA